MNVRTTPIYYETLLKEARTIVSRLRDVGIKAYITGGLALDRFTHQLREHKDIDIFIDGYSSDLVGRVDSIMRSLGYEAIHWGGRKDGSVGILVYTKETGLMPIFVDVFFKSFNAIMPYFGEVIPYSEDDYYLNELLVFGHYLIGSGLQFDPNSKDAKRLRDMINYLRSVGKL
jgi:hypothetical protein